MDKIINWMGGWPKEGLVPASEWEERLAAAADRAVREPFVPGSLSRDGMTLEMLLANGLLRSKARQDPSRLRLAQGADAALSMLVRRSLSAGDVVLTEPLTSRSALQIFRKAGVRIEAAAGDEEGMDPDALRKAIRRFRPRLVYAMPVVSDPAGAVWTKGRISAVGRVCRAGGVTLLRDDRLEMLLYEKEDEQAEELGPAEDGVISIGQLPPGLVAGLRFGWAAGDPRELRRWLPADSYPDPDPETEAAGGVTMLERLALADLIREQPLEPLLELFRGQSEERLRRLALLLRQQQVPGLAFRLPAGGVHLWVTLPEGLDAEALLRAAWIKGLMFQPGAPFFAARPQPNTLRLTFAYADEREMKLGTARLAESIGEFMGRFAHD